MDLTQRFYNFLQTENLIAPGENVLIALSGGKDSVCLTQLLIKARKEFGFHLAACHVHHGIRGEEADRDALFCKQLCEKLSIPLYIEYCDIPKFCKENKLGLEEGARTERYRLLGEAAMREGFHKIATAHSASDQAETILFRLIRGTGFSGAKGIAPKRENIIRPLLPFSSEEIEAYLGNHQIPFTQDSSNSDIIYSRNLIRKKIFPLMEKVNPQARDALNRLGTMSVWQEKMLEKLWKKTEVENNFSADDGFIPRNVATLLAQDESDYPLLYYGLSKLVKKHNISIDFGHFKTLCSLLNRYEQGKIIEISNGFCFEIQKKRVVFTKHERQLPGIEYQIELSDGENVLPFALGTLSLCRTECTSAKNINKKSLIIKLDSDKISGRLSARNLCRGDRIQMYGMHKSIKKMLCDSGIPKEHRQNIPIVCDDEEIVWVPFLGLCDKVRNETPKNVTTLSLFGETPETIRQCCKNEISKTP